MDSGCVATTVIMTSLSLLRGHAPGKLLPYCPDVVTGCACVVPTKSSVTAARYRRHGSPLTMVSGLRVPPVPELTSKVASNSPSYITGLIEVTLEYILAMLQRLTVFSYGPRWHPQFQK